LGLFGGSSRFFTSGEYERSVGFRNVQRLVSQIPGQILNFEK